MSNNKEIKIKRLLDLHVPGTVLLASWLDAKGFSHDLQQRYKKSAWLESIGVGAFKRPNEQIDWLGGIYSIQNQSSHQVIIGGLSALSLQGISHYIRMGEEKVFVYSPAKTVLPAWFQKYPWERQVEHIKSSFLPFELGIIPHETGGLTVNISSPERAILECLYLVPNKMDIMEVYQLISGLVNLRPTIVQKLLEECNSIKVKRLFLYMAKKADHQWFQFLDLKNVKLGKGDRSIIKNGVYNSKYQITVSKELAQL